MVAVQECAPAGHLPRLVEGAVALTACDDPDAHYDFGVTVFLAGVEAIAAREKEGTHQGDAAR